MRRFILGVRAIGAEELFPPMLVSVILHFDCEIICMFCLAEKKPRIATTERKAPARKSQNTSSVDDPAPAKPSPGEPGVLTPTESAPKSKTKPPSNSGSKPSTDADSKPSTTSDDASTTSDELKDLDEEANNQGAYNPETGEINWDCPCLGGMAHGPCGMQFRDAFSCFIHSEEEPKGVDCVEKFKAMQDCFREHPDVYGEGESCWVKAFGCAFILVG